MDSGWLDQQMLAHQGNTLYAEQPARPAAAPSTVLGYYSTYINLNGNHVFFPDVCARACVCASMCVCVCVFLVEY